MINRLNELNDIDFLKSLTVENCFNLHNQQYIIFFKNGKAYKIESGI